jgi:hypothetical protein
METIIVETENKEQAETVKAVLKALKVSYTSTDNTKAKRIAESIREGYKEAIDIESGKLEAKSYSSFKDLLDEL